MKTILTTLGVFGLAFNVLAGDKNTMVAPPMIDTTCPCWTDGINVGGHVAGIFLDDGGDDSIGGGINISYFLTDRLGLELGYTAFDTEPAVEHLSTLDAVYRFANDSCLAPYLIGGGGVLSNGSNRGLWRLGAGIEYRLGSCVGIFADGTYNWIEDGPEATVARVGVRIPF